MTDSTLHANAERALGEQIGPAASTAVRANIRVLIYGLNYAPEPIGVGRYTGEIGAYIAKHNVDVEVVAAVPHYPGWSLRDGYLNWYSVKWEDGARVSRCPLILSKKMRGIWRLIAPLSFALLSAPVVLWRITTLRPDAVLCVEPTLFAAPIALFAAKLTGARTVLHVQDLEVDAAFAVGHLTSNRLKSIALWFERRVRCAFDIVVTISERMRMRLIEKGVAAEKARIVRNWVDLDKIKPLDRPSLLRQEMGVSNDTFVVLYAGNIGPKQALYLLLEAAVRLAGLQNVLFVIAGEGPEKPNLMNKYCQLPNVRFLPLQPEEKLCELLNLADVHVLPQLEGTADLFLPSKLGGMLASGKACIVMANPETELHDFLAGGAQIVPPGDSEALAGAIVAAIKSDRLAGSKLRLSLANRIRSGRNLNVLLHLILREPLVVADR